MRKKCIQTCVLSTDSYSNCNIPQKSSSAPANTHWPSLLKVTSAWGFRPESLICLTLQREPYCLPSKVNRLIFVFEAPTVFLSLDNETSQCCNLSATRPEYLKPQHEHECPHVVCMRSDNRPGEILFQASSQKRTSKWSFLTEPFHPG